MVEDFRRTVGFVACSLMRVWRQRTFFPIYESWQPGQENVYATEPWYSVRVRSLHGTKQFNSVVFAIHYKFAWAFYASVEFVGEFTQQFSWQGTWIQTLLMFSGGSVMALVWLAGDDEGLNVFISFGDCWGKPFQDINFEIWSSSTFSVDSELHILCGRLISTLIQAVFRNQGVKLEMWEYWPVCVDLRKIVVPSEVI